MIYHPGSSLILPLCAVWSVCRLAAAVGSWNGLPVGPNGSIQSWLNYLLLLLDSRTGGARVLEVILYRCRLWWW